MNGKAARMHNLKLLFERCPTRRIGPEDRITIISDLHMGDGSRNDDFRHNGELFCTVLEQFYAEHGFHLILNGDVEDLHRFSFRSIVRRWPSVYKAFAAVDERGGLTRIVGNHDAELLERGSPIHALAMLGQEHIPGTFADNVQEALRLVCSSGDIFVYHGHQSSRWFQEHNHLGKYFMRYVANPLHIRSPTVAEDSRKKFRVERRAYQFASQRKILAVIGHTHRPLFESMSRSDTLLFEIELLCRSYPESENKEEVEERVQELKEELNRVSDRESPHSYTSSLYRENLVVPSLFNSGSVLGKRGMTCLEIEDCRLRLVYWYDSAKRERFRRYPEHQPEALGNTRFMRAVIQEEDLDYVFSRVRLLA